MVWYLSWGSSDVVLSLICRDHSEYGLSQGEEASLCSTFSHWLSPYPEWSMVWFYFFSMTDIKELILKDTSPCVSRDLIQWNPVINNHQFSPKYSQLILQEKYMGCLLSVRTKIFVIPLQMSLCMQYCSRDQSRSVPSQWETLLHCNDVSHWLGAYIDWSLFYYLLHHNEVSLYRPALRHFTKSLSAHDLNFAEIQVAPVWKTSVPSGHNFSHATTAVVACAKLWPDFNIRIRITGNRIFTKFQLWAHKRLVEWVSDYPLH